MASPTVQQTAERPRAARAPVSPYRQLLRLTRTELTLFHRYRMALYIAVFPLVFVLIGVASEGEEALAGIDAAPHYITGTPALVAMAIGLWHISNVYAARREQLVLKRFRASGVTPFALFGASTLAVLAVVLLLTAVIGGFLAWRYGVWPADPAMVVLPLVLTTVLMSLLGAAFTRVTRNAESAQLMAMFPFLLLYGASGLMVPLEMMPDRLAAVLGLLPLAPAVEMIRSGYLGYDLVNGVEGASAATGPDLWTAALPSMGLLLAWLALSVYLLRYFRWDPRQEQ